MERNRIHLLSERVTNKIAAGEVVERPASVLKELIENAIDAGADQVDVEVVDGGRRALSVADNGCGMDSEDALMAIQRYATSKIEDVDDIEQIGTMGFRGEALAAISSVSRFRMVTSTADSSEGTEVSLSGGKMQSVESIGAPVGTSVEVRNLFFNVPARRKFMRTAQTELTHSRQRFLVYALSHPEIGMTFKSDEKPLYSLSAGDSLEYRIAEIYGESLRNDLRCVEHRQNGISVSGYAALPRASRSDRSDQLIFINGRPATAPVLAYAVREGYHTLLPSGRHPVLFLFIELDPSMVDVNVHPTKREVRFRRSNEVRDAIISSIKNALRSSGTTPAMPTEVTSGSSSNRNFSFEQRPGIRINDLPSTPVFRYPRMSMLAEPSRTAPQDADSKRISDPEDHSGDSPPWAQCRVLGQVGGLFVVLETEDGMVLMDPHASHERVMYEKFMQQVLTGKVHSQGLLYPETLEMSPENAATILKNEKILQKMGFGISSFGGDSFIVDAVPSCLGKISVVDVVEGLAKAAEHGGDTASVEHSAQKRIAMAACKAAVKGGDSLNLTEIEQLVNDLARSQMPYTCPHGRPTMIFMSLHELQKKFGRITS